MKTQIFRFVLLAAIALFISFGSNGYKTQLSIRQSFSFNLGSEHIAVNIVISANTKNITHARAGITCSFCSSKNEELAINEPNGEHEFHTFHIKDRAHRHLGFWKLIVKKVVSAVYYIIVLFACIPFKH